jgi:hypothetical protein
MTSDVSPELNFADRTTRDLFRIYRATLNELKARGIIRTENAPAGDYAEYLVHRALGGRLAPNSEKSWDVELANAERIQVKCRVVPTPMLPGHRQLSAFRSFDFEAAVIVFFSDLDYSVIRATKLPRTLVEANSKHRKHDNSYVFHATEMILADPSAIDLTDLMRAAA